MTARRSQSMHTSTSGSRPPSWSRAKQDFPLAGRYSSDDAHVLRDQVQQAKGAGIGGFLTSWKSTDTLNRRLDLLVRIAHSENLDLGVVYEALDFHRHPLPAATVQRDLVYLVGRWGSSLTSRYYGRPVIIWTGTDQYTTAEVHAVKVALGNRAYLLAASRSVSGYERVAEIVDGEAYYWSSADPSSASTTAKLNAFGQAVHAHRGLWFAPAASGYDGRSLGGTRVIGRDNGRTLVKSLDNAFASSPNAVAVISWNEWSENTYIEPGKKYGDRELLALKAYQPASGQSIPPPLTGADSSQGDNSSGSTGAAGGPDPWHSDYRDRPRRVAAGATAFAPAAWWDGPPHGSSGPVEGERPQAMDRNQRGEGRVKTLTAFVDQGTPQSWTMVGHGARSNAQPLDKAALLIWWCAYLVVREWCGYRRSRW